MMEKSKYAKLKIAIDILSCIFIGCWAIIPFWWHYDPTIDNHSGPMPLQMKIFLADGFPFAFAIIWLTNRYGVALALKYPFVITMQFRILLPLAAFAIVIIMHILWGVK